jgi:hypothetical protein
MKNRSICNKIVGTIADKMVSVVKPRKDEDKMNELLKDSIYPISYNKNSDVFIASYPKSGVTWLRYILCNLIYGINPQKCPNSLLNMIIPDVHYSNWYLRVGDRTVFKSHHLPRPEMKKVVHLIRDGRDVITSYYNMLKNQGYDFSMEEIIVKDKGVFPSDWSTHCASWYVNPYQAEIFCIRYEELKREPIGRLKSLCGFLGIQADEASIRDAVDKASFKNLQKREKDTGELSDVMTKGPFFRRGEIGSYKDELTEEHLRLFGARHGSMLHQLGYL